MKPRKPLRKVSVRRQKDNAVYPQRKRRFLLAHTFCFRCNEWQPLYKRTLHHFFGRTGLLLTYVPGFRMACMKCHTWIETHRNEAARQGYRAEEQIFGRPSLVMEVMK